MLQNLEEPLVYWTETELIVHRLNIEPDNEEETTTPTIDQIIVTEVAKNIAKRLKAVNKEMNKTE